MISLDPIPSTGTTDLQLGAGAFTDCKPTMITGTTVFPAWSRCPLSPPLEVKGETFSF